VNIVHSEERTAANDGTFSFPVFDPDCNRYRFSASKPSDFWLPSNQNVFTGVPSQPVQIVLGPRGGKVQIQVWDVATDRFIRAQLDISRKTIAGKQFGSLQTATNLDGSAITELLPSGEYSVKVISYPCANVEYWTSNGPASSFIVKPETVLRETLRIDIRNIKPRPRFDGHPRPRCSVNRAAFR